MSDLNPRWQGVRRLLAMRLDNIGDCLMTGPALRALRETLHDAHITLMVAPSAREAAPLLPWIDEVLVWRSLWQDMGNLPFDPSREFGLLQMLQAQRFDAAVIFTSFSQTPHVAAYACYLAGIPLRLGEPKDFGGAVLSDQPSSPTHVSAHQVERNLRLVESIGCRTSDRSLALCIPPTATLQVRALLRQHGIPQDSPYLLLNPWTSCQARTYKRFGQVGRLLREKTGWPVVVCGTPRDLSSYPQLEAEIGGATGLVGKTSVPELAALVAGARLLLTNNTATMHIADALRTPQVVLFAGTEMEEQWAPRHGPAILLRRPTSCQPCYLLDCHRHQACLDIEPAEVAAAAMSLLGTAPAAVPASGTEA
ncbi:MAG: glycosyltransferase family 9 protein [Anaerolineae bacterium]